MSFGGWRLFALPLLFLAVCATSLAAWRAIDIQTEEALVGAIKLFFDRYGLATVLVSAFIEGLLLIGWYFPGTFVIILAIALASPDPGQAIAATALAALGLTGGYLVNFFIGRYGWYRVLIAFGLRGPLARAEQRLRRHGLSAIFTTYWQPNLASLTSTAAGILQVDLRAFAAVSALAAALWMGFWGGLVYALGPSALAIAGPRLVLILLIGWVLSRLALRLLRR